MAKTSCNFIITLEPWKWFYMLISIIILVLITIMNVLTMMVALNRPTFWRIIKRKDTGQFSGVPYVATLLNCLMWTFYGTDSVAGLMLVVTINVAGLIIESCYIFIHLIFGNYESRVRNWSTKLTLYHIQAIVMSFFFCIFFRFLYLQIKHFHKCCVVNFS